MLLRSNSTRWLGNVMEDRASACDQQVMSLTANRALLG